MIPPRYTMIANSLRNTQRNTLAIGFAALFSLTTVLFLKSFPITYPLLLIQNLKNLFVTSTLCARLAWFSCSTLFDSFFAAGLFVVLQLTKITRILHEGAHLVAAHWYFGVSEKIRAKGIHVFVEDCPKSTWLRIALFPLVLPLAFLIVLMPLIPNFAIAFFLLMLLWSCKDFPNIILVYRSPGNTVRDIEEGLFVVD